MPPKAIWEICVGATQDVTKDIPRLLPSRESRTFVLGATWDLISTNAWEWLSAHVTPVCVCVMFPKIARDLRPAKFQTSACCLGDFSAALRFSLWPFSPLKPTPALGRPSTRKANRGRAPAVRDFVIQGLVVALPVEGLCIGPGHGRARKKQTQ